MIKAVILDFDGVILESMDAKAKAFAELFKDHPEHLNDIIEFHLNNGGMNRNPKIRAIIRNILHQSLSDGHLNELCDSFGELAILEVRKSPFVPGSLEFIRASWKKYLLCIVSATPQLELEEIVAERQLSPYFQLILGAPASKDTNLAKVIDHFELHPAEAVFVGDALADYEGAEKTGIYFVGRVAQSKVNPFAGLKVLGMINDLSALESALEQHTASIQSANLSRCIGTS